MSNLVRLEKSLEQTLESHCLEVTGGSYNNLVEAYTNLNRLKEAWAIAKKRKQKALIPLTCAPLCTRLPSYKTMPQGMKEQN